MKNFEFARYTDVTKMALELNADYNSAGIIKVLICGDVHDNWLVRIYENTNEDFEVSEGTFLVERDKIAKEYKGEPLTLRIVNRIIEDDCLEAWDNCEAVDLEEALDMVSDGFGINNLES